MKTGFKVMGIANVGNQKRVSLIRHLIEKGISYDGLISMNATHEEILEANRS